MSLYAGQVLLPWMGFSLLLQHQMWSDCISDYVFVDHLEEKRGSYTTVPSQCLWKGSGFAALSWYLFQRRQSCENTHLFLKCLCIVCVVHMNRIATCPSLIRTSSGHVSCSLLCEVLAPTASLSLSLSNATCRELLYHVWHFLSLNRCGFVGDFAIIDTMLAVASENSFSFCLAVSERSH